MIRIRKILILLLLLSSEAADSQSAFDTLPYSIDSVLLDIKVDLLSNIWYIYDNKIVRKSMELSYIDTLSLPQNTIPTIDVSNPLKNLFFYKNQNQVEIKNSRWAAVSKFRLDQLQIYQPSFVHYSLDKRIWTLDMNTNQLYQLNENGVKMTEKPNPFIDKNQTFYPTKGVFSDHYGYFLDTSSGIFVLDDYANLVQFVTMKTVHAIFVYRDHIYLCQKNTMYRVNKKRDGELDLNYSKVLTLPSQVISLQTLNDKALLFLRDKRVFQIKNLEKLFE